jgi:ADP-ribose pyrophosphatase YjhB (NUDIX family)
MTVDWAVVNALREASKEAFRPVAVEVAIISQDLRGSSISNTKPDEPVFKILLAEVVGENEERSWALPGVLMTDEGQKKTDKKTSKSEKPGLIEGPGEIDDWAVRLTRKILGEVSLYQEQLLTYAGPIGAEGGKAISCVYLVTVPPVEEEPPLGLKWVEVTADNAGKKAADKKASGEKDADNAGKKGADNAGRWRPLEKSYLNGPWWALEAAMNRIRQNPFQAKIMESLMPPRFTVNHFRRVHEIILGKKLPAPAFRRTVSRVLSKTEEFERRKKYRPSRLFSLKG